MFQILETHPNGVWSSKVPGEYTELHGEKLPADWLKQIMEFPQVDSNVISDKQIILTLIESPTDMGINNQPAIELVTVRALIKLPRISTLVIVTNCTFQKIETPAVQIAAEESTVNQPPPINLPKEEHWDIYITNANSTAELWLRLVGDTYSVGFRHEI